ncbi:hypothetical protein AK830_g1976 [Neonectria ditissima]|uniref:Lytic polysaccharide monooxygenase n=1 Tax=Neonectria ditissima TaxID=78410 RepID=A0A0P7B4J0_9HYPO|nr:hypothetical protein AK830_g1976 [Neonectria ditissima]
MFNTRSCILTLALVVGKLSAHVVMIEPHPYNLDTEPLLQSWPLDAQLPFPCQGRSQHAEKVTTVTAGAAQTVKLWGSAVHGGGSCQFGVAYGDAPPDDPAEWHTIYSIIGGCPAEAAGNIPTTEKDPHGRENGPQCGNDVDKECTREFTIQIPKEMKNGPAVFAWTWFNKIGNREMYMNCAPIEIVGGSEDSAFVDKLPPMFRANIPGECTTGQSGSVIGFPDPGEYGKIYEGITPGGNGGCEAGVEPVFKEAAGGDASKPADTPMGAASPTGAATGTPSATPSSIAVSYSTPLSSTAAPSTLVSFVTESPAATSAAATSVAAEVPSGPASSAAKETPSVAATSAVKEPASSEGCPVDESAPAPSGTPKSSGPPGSTPCPTDGGLICITPKTFGICSSGFALPQDVPAGTVCVNNGIAHDGSMN